MYRQLAPEMWVLVMQHLPPRDQRTCLFVSSTVHTIARRFVFSDVPVTLGLWKGALVEGETQLLSKAIQDDVSRRARSSLALLKHAANVSDFADSIKKLTLTSFALLERHAFDSGAGPPPVATAERILTANADTLQRLCISSSPETVSVLYGSDPEAFTRLEELSLIFPHTVDGLDAVFTHCTALRSLTFCVSSDNGVDEAVTEALRTYPSALPHLTSLKLHHRTGFPRGTAPAQDIADFVLGHPGLRRLDVVLGPSALAFYGGCPLMWALPKLPALAVLGFDFYPAYLVRGLVQFLDLNLPRALSALHMYARVGQADMSTDDWAVFFEERNALRFINVVCDKAESVGLRDVLFRRPPRALELLGFNFGMHAVSRVPATGKPVFAEPWSWPKTFHASLDRSGSGSGGGEDGEEDWEWLLRHHGHNDKIDIAEWMLKASDDGADPQRTGARRSNGLAEGAKLNGKNGRNGKRGGSTGDDSMETGG
ncbi:hypothetical protein GSI_12098 [Ganoderma sinense ZZ0214-1]|uniref:Uncharacterized protein n=1 Tax=Ganoderma sinense ZZ0214-1 TaxID=1077348 RepID=A0A2G8RXV9_9APHY|nr:hypothetical protein GSI_12098 [Ganoderma sinense ZZ0214-1]